MVALANAWVTGAQQWSQAKRTALATDPLNLLAVDSPTNAAKGAGDAATWLPPVKGYRCAYVARQVAVKKKYGAWVTAPERAAIARVLATCPGTRLPTSSVIVLGGSPLAKAAASTPAPSTTTARSAPSTTTSGGHRIVHPGSFCAPVGATGYTTKGTRMRCSLKSGDPRARWRSA